jgi:acetyl-CoA acetyltransferase
MQQTIAISLADQLHLRAPGVSTNTECSTYSAAPVLALGMLKATNTLPVTVMGVSRLSDVFETDSLIRHDQL